MPADIRVEPQYTIGLQPESSTITLSPTPSKPAKRKPSACRHLTEDEDAHVMAIAALKTDPWAKRNYCYIVFYKRTGYRVSEGLSLKVRDA